MRIDQAGDRRTGGNRPEHGQLGLQHHDVGQVVPAERDRRHKARNILPKILGDQRFTPRHRCRRYRPVKANLENRTYRRFRAILGDDLADAALNMDTRVGPDKLLDLESTFDFKWNKPQQSSFSLLRDIFTHLPACRTVGFMKARG
ncbi:hypothetical protein GCM10010389_36340 [Streptomyces echinoruber]|uniref:Uncharacterized protein n=1 Tax=Streptomyces echinoruber TaxID=68898 RepID=A0A918REF9_9ACTN|nr:hypothetical protein GCM10010389_36340 [Streptomyces echinoruber]